LVTGVLAKEVVVGTLNTLYSQQANLTKEEGEHFNLWQGLKDAVMSVPNNLAGLGSALSNPFKADESPHEMNHAVYGVMSHQFGDKRAAFAYLLFVLLYFPCVSTMAAMRREVGQGWASFSMAWSFVMAYGIAVLAYQLLTLTDHPLFSIEWISAVLAVFIAIGGGLILYARKELAVSSDQTIQGVQ